MLPPSLIRYRRPLVFSAHAALTVIAYAAAFALRFDGQVPMSAVRAFGDTVLVLVAMRLALFTLFGMHRGFWKHFSLHDLITLGKAVGLGTLCFGAGLWALGELGAVPSSVVLLEGMLTLMLLGGTRLAVR